MTIDKLSIMFNLACCYSRMSSRMELSWNDVTNNETGAYQACNLYQQAAGIYCDIEETLSSIKNSANEALWEEVKSRLGTDLQVETCSMLKNVMLAQAQYL